MALSTSFPAPTHALALQESLKTKQYEVDESHGAATVPPGRQAKNKMFRQKDDPA